MSTPPYDALLLVSFGGPDRPEDVVPFLENVTRGRNIPPERLAEVAERYYARGGVSPINDANRRLRDALAAALDIPVYWGNRNWHPYLAETIAEMRADGITNALAYVTSVFASYSSCRQYLENIADARTAVGVDAPRVDRLRHAFDHPKFIEAFTETTRAALSSVGHDVRVLFTAHSIPMTMARASGPTGGLYVEQLEVAAALIADRVQRPYDLVFQSRSGRPGDPWLEPDLLSVIDTVDEPAVVVVPLGFTADHMEVVYDIDVEAAAHATARGLRFARAATPGTHPAYVEMIVELVAERRHGLAPRALSSLGPSYDVCPPDCCLARG